MVDPAKVIIPSARKPRCSSCVAPERSLFQLEYKKVVTSEGQHRLPRDNSLSLLNIFCVTLDRCHCSSIIIKINRCGLKIRASVLTNRNFLFIRLRNRDRVLSASIHNVKHCREPSSNRFGAIHIAGST